MPKHFNGLYIFLLCLVQVSSFAQKSLIKGDEVSDLSIKKTLNAPSITSFTQMQDKLIILDFFGTWCAPCLRALPRLKEIKEQFTNGIDIILVSNETEAQLDKFIKARKDFPFPVIVDEDNRWNQYFQPPSLPYTVVIKQGKVVAITKAEDITPTAVQIWLAGNNHATQGAVNKKDKTESKSNIMSANEKSANPILKLSQDFIYTSKTGAAVQPSYAKIKELSYQSLLNTLTTDNTKKAFWINIYNGYIQAELKTSPEKYKNRNAFFKKTQIEVAGKRFSLDGIEHGILRRSKIKWSLGYFNKLFPSKQEKELRVGNLDYRIHFALNCGAKSCPPIAFYNPDILDEQLSLATKAYLSGEASYDSSTNILELPKLMTWFRGDFGGKKGMIAIAKKLDLISQDIHPKIKFKNYDWSLTLDNYKNYE